MGLLDDAIREHLELKRRRGADPDEVARQEDEALGAPRRGEFAQPDGPAGPQPDEDLERAPEEPQDAVTDEAPAAGTAADPGAHEEPWLEEDALDPVAARAASAFPPSDAEPGPDDQSPAPPPAADEDVLEETPEFLQETPEHDRLWFEQKPPRDFDFDR